MQKFKDCASRTPWRSWTWTRKARRTWLVPMEGLWLVLNWSDWSLSQEGLVLNACDTVLRWWSPGVLSKPLVRLIRSSLAQRRGFPQWSTLPLRLCLLKAYMVCFGIKIILLLFPHLSSESARAWTKRRGSCYCFDLHLHHGSIFARRSSVNVFSLTLILARLVFPFL